MDFKCSAMRCVADGELSQMWDVLAPNIAVPIRICVAPSSIAIEKSCDMPIESSFSPILGGRSAKRYEEQIQDDNTTYCRVGLWPKIAVPTRTMVAPSSMATGKSLDMPKESSSSARRG